MEFKSSKFVVLKSFGFMVIGGAVLSLLVYSFTKNDVYALITLQ